MFSQTSELLLCSSSLEGRGKKSGGKVPVTSFLRPPWGLRRGRARFLWKHQEGLGTRCPACWAGGTGRRTSPGGLAAGSPFPAPLLSRTEPGAACSFEVPQQISDDRGATRALDPGPRAPSLQRPPHPRAQSGPSATSQPARLSPGPDGF